MSDTHLTEKRPDDARSLILRNAHPEEHEAVAQVIRAAYSEYLPRLSEERRGRYLDRTADVGSRLEGSDLIVAELDGRIVGTLTFFANQPDASVGGWPVGWAGLRVLAVDPETRGWGIGRKLMEESIHRARASGAIAVGLHTTEMMAIARAMYERMGFVRVPDLDFHPSSGNPVIAYRYDLAEGEQK